MDGGLFSIYIVCGCFGVLGAIIAAIFLGSFVSKSGKCSVFPKNRQSTVSNKVSIYGLLQLITNNISKNFLLTFLQKIHYIFLNHLQFEPPKSAKSIRTRPVTARSIHYANIENEIRHTSTPIPVASIDGDSYSSRNYACKYDRTISVSNDVFNIFFSGYHQYQCMKKLFSSFFRCTRPQS